MLPVISIALNILGGTHNYWKSLGSFTAEMPFDLSSQIAQKWKESGYSGRGA